MPGDAAKFSLVTLYLTLCPGKSVSLLRSSMNSLRLREDRSLPKASQHIPVAPKSYPTLPQVFLPLALLSVILMGVPSNHPI